MSSGPVTSSRRLFVHGPTSPWGPSFPDPTPAVVHPPGDGVSGAEEGCTGGPPTHDEPVKGRTAGGRGLRRTTVGIAGPVAARLLTTRVPSESSTGPGGRCLIRGERGVGET